MSSPVVRTAYLHAIDKFWNDTDAVAARAAKIKATNVAKYGHAVYTQCEEYLATHDRFKSKAEDEISSFFNNLGFHTRKRREGGVELDIYIEELNLAIEYNGAYWHSSLFKEKDYHLKKTEFCHEEGIKLIHIFDHEWENKRSQVLDFLLSKTNKFERIHARKCASIVLDRSSANAFLDKNHIQGGARGAQLYLGLQHEGELVSVAAFGKHHRQTDVMVMKRFASKCGSVVVGGLGKLSKLGSVTLGQDIISWCDRRWSDGKSYQSAGWIPEAILEPSYFYIKNGRYACSKQARRKNAVNTPVGMTEREHAAQDGFFRVYDCGKIRFRYKVQRP